MPDTGLSVGLDVGYRLSSYQYAAYGSNLHPLRLQERVPSAKLLGTSALPGYDLRFNKVSWKDGSGKCNLVYGDSDGHVAIFEVLEAERILLDQAEGLGYGYDRASLDVDGFGLCSTYIAASNAVDDTIRPFDWYKELVVLGCAFNSFPNHHVSSVIRVPAVVDTDGARSSEMWTLVKTLQLGVQKRTTL